MSYISQKKNKATKFSQCRTFDQCFKEGLISQSTYLFAQKLGFKDLSPIQNAVIPLILKRHKDVLIEACTGSGKTLAFLIPIVEILLQKLNDVSFTQPYCCNVGALCLAPTRELATQIENVLSTYLSIVNDNCNTGKNNPLQKISSILFTGGGTYEKDCLFFSKKDKAWESFTILVATPGRLCSLVENLKLNTDWTFSNLNVLVFDEADRLLVQRASFEIQLSSILKILPKQRVTLLVSATLSNELIILLKAGIRNSVLVRIESTSSTTTPNPILDSSDVLYETTNNENDEERLNQISHATPDHLTNFYCILRRYSKVSFLLKFLIAHVLPGNKNKNGKKCIIFFLTCYYAHYFYKLFSKLKEMYPVALNTKIFCLNGKMSAKSRISETLRFRKVQEDNSSAILFATDVAARGLDFPDVSWIVQYDPPTDPNMFLHRIGRTARAGKTGHSLTLLCPSEETYIPFLTRRQVRLTDFNIKAQHLLDDCLRVNLSNMFPLDCFTTDFPQALNEFDNNFTSLDEIQSNENYLQLSMDDLKSSWRVCRTILLSDQDFIQKAAKAFVSFIRAYKENHLQYIFVFKDLEIGELAFSLALLRLPRVKEILGKHVHGFYQSSIAPRKIPYKDVTKQEFYKQKLALSQEEKKKKKPSMQIVVKPLVKKRNRTDQKRAQRQRVLEEIEELQKDERLYKKLKKKKLSTEEYHRLLEE